MMFETSLRIALEALGANKARSLLTMLGIVIGVMSVVVLVALGQASQAYITEQVQGLGAGVLVVMPGNPKSGNMLGSMVAAQTLTLDDADAIAALNGVDYVTPSSKLFSLLKSGNRQYLSQVTGCTPTILNVQSLKMGSGRFFSEQEARQGKRVAVIGAKVARELLMTQALDPDSASVRIEGQRFRVIGLLADQGGSSLGSLDDVVLIPITAFQQTLKAGHTVDSILIKATSPEQMERLSVQVERLLRQRHRIRADEDDDAKVQTQAELLATVGTITGVFTALLAGIASISLLVGGIGIMNIMLVSVTERTREIGIRKAVGAKRRDILAQFLIEAASLSLLGGIIGMILGAAIAYAATRAVKLPFVVSPAAIAGAFVFSASVGIFFGLYPANRAAKLDPVEALRYE